MTKARWLLIALGVSLALNLALVGFLAGRAAGPPPFFRAAIGVDPTVGLGRMLRFLPDDRRREVLGREAPRRIRESLAAVRETQRALDRQLREDDFDAAEVAATLQAFRERFAESQARSHAALVAAAGRLTPAERAQLVAQMRERPRGRRGDRPRRREGPGRERP